MNPITLTTAQLKAMMGHVGKGDVRPHINCLLLQVRLRGGKPVLFIVGCDGHRMAVARYDAPGWPQLTQLLTRDGVEEVLAKARAAKSKVVELAPENDVVAMGPPGDLTPVPSYGGRAIDWENSVPTRVEPGMSRLNAHYVAEAVSLLAKFSESKYPGVVAARSGSCTAFTLADGDGPTDPSGPTKVVVVVMGMRGDDDADISGLLT